MKKIICFIFGMLMLVASAFSLEVEYNGTKYTEEQWDAYIEQFDIETQYKMDADATYIYTEKEARLNELYKEAQQLIEELKYLRVAEQPCAAAQAEVVEKLHKVQSEIKELESDN